MFPINTPTAVDNKFVAGTPLTPATQVDPGWFNRVQAELLCVLAGAEIEPDLEDNGQVLTAINALIAGAVSATVDAMAPHVTQLLEGKELHSTLYDTVHYRKPDGASLLRADYPEAWAAILTSGQLAVTHADWLTNKTLWGPGIDADHFDMKDLRAVVTRIDNDGKAGALGPALGYFKANQNKAHDHTLPIGGGGAGQTIISDAEPAVMGPKATGSSGGDEACMDHTSLRYVIRMK